MCALCNSVFGPVLFECHKESLSYLNAKYDLINFDFLPYQL